MTAEPALIEALDLMLEMQCSVLMSVARIGTAVGNTIMAQDLRDEAEAHALWVKQWRERYALPKSFVRSGAQPAGL